MPYTSGQWVQKIRENAGYSRKIAATKSTVSEGAWRRIENNQFADWTELQAVFSFTLDLAKANTQSSQRPSIAEAEAARGPVTAVQSALFSPSQQSFCQRCGYQVPRSFTDKCPNCEEALA